MTLCPQCKELRKLVKDKDAQLLAEAEARTAAHLRARLVLREVQGVLTAWQPGEPPPEWEHPELIKAACGQGCCTLEGRPPKGGRRALESVAMVLRWVVR